MQLHNTASNPAKLISQSAQKRIIINNLEKARTGMVHIISPCLAVGLSPLDRSNIVRLAEIVPRYDFDYVNLIS